MFNVYMEKCGQKQELYGKAESEEIAVRVIRNAIDIAGGFEQVRWSSILGLLKPFCEVLKRNKTTDRFYVEQVQ